MAIKVRHRKVLYLNRYDLSDMDTNPKKNSESEDVKYSITIKDTGELYSCSKGQHLLQGMTSLGKKGIPSGCHGGGCGVCKIRIVSGRYKTISMSRAHISEEEERDGVTLACRTYPQDNLDLEVIGQLHKKVMYGFC